MTEQTIRVGEIEAVILRKDIRHMYLQLVPPAGGVRVTAPFAMREEVIRGFLEKKLRWILRSRQKFVYRPRPPKLQYVTGEQHPVFGIEYPLQVIDSPGRPRVELRADSILLHARPRSSRKLREKLLQEWYRALLKERVPGLMRKWEGIVGVQSSGWNLKKMKTRWGTCNRKTRFIWINLELAKLPEIALEYLLCHELVHLHERNHNARFYAFMDRFMPGWQEVKKRLNEWVIR